VRKSVSTCCRKDFILVVSVWQVLILPRAVLPFVRAAKASGARWSHLSRCHKSFYLLLRYSPAISLTFLRRHGTIGAEPFLNSLNSRTRAEPRRRIEEHDHRLFNVQPADDAHKTASER
jgi:hypothetical protein